MFENCGIHVVFCFRVLNLCGSSVSLEPVKKVLLRCPHVESLNLSSCRALPRGMKRLYTGKELQDLKDSLDPAKAKTKEENKEGKGKKKKDAKNTEPDLKSEDKSKSSDTAETSESKIETKSKEESSPAIFQEPKSVTDSESSFADKTPTHAQTPSRTDKSEQSISKIPEIASPLPEGRRSTRHATPKLLSPLPHSKPDSSSTPRSDPVKTDFGSPHYSPVPKPDSQVQNSPEVQPESVKSNSWKFKTTPTYRSEASPLSRLEGHNKLKHGKVIEQCSPTTSLENKTSPETIGVKQDIKNPNSWNYGNYSPMPKQDPQFSSQRSPYSAQPSPAQPSPYSTQPSPYSTQPSPYSSQPSPYSAQPSPDTSQIVKPDLQKSGAWNTGNFSPMPKHHAPFSPRPSTHTSPDSGMGMKADTLRNNPNKTPGQYSPMSRQDRLQHSPYSPRQIVETVTHSNKKSPAAAGNYSPMMRLDCHLPSPDGGQPSRTIVSGRPQDLYSRSMPKMPEVLQNAPPPDMPGSWGLDRFNTTTPSIDSLVWGPSTFNTEPPPPRTDNIPAMLNTPPPQQWTGMPSFDTSARKPEDDPWMIGQFREEPPQQMHNTFDQNICFDALSGHISHQVNMIQNYLEENFSESSCVD